MAVQLTTDWNDLSAEEVIRLKEELRIMRELRNQSSEGRLPYLPHYSGDDGVKLEHYLSACDIYYSSLCNVRDSTNAVALLLTDNQIVEFSKLSSFLIEPTLNE